MSRVFTKRVCVRFSDCIFNRQMHYTKFYEFFEMARFDVWDEFCQFYLDKIGESLQKKNWKFVVVKIKGENFKEIKNPVKDEIEILTTLTIQKSTLMEFEHEAYSDGILMVKSTVKIVVLDEGLNLVKKWDDSMYKLLKIFCSEEML